ncbi:MAG: PEP/pyruvate-binding domain-containing protein [Candidatus Hydrogenedentes bacterium]|nr:PEP/pyruvate-binding domain-containing protein [Candidatus Hydrogenedentota bacterium]
MPHSEKHYSTGSPGLDRVLHGLRAGDNIVWEVGGVDDYRAMILPFAAQSMAQGKSVTYFRFARHAPVLDTQTCSCVYPLHPQAGFEVFLDAIHMVIEKNGRGALYVFDSLSDLTVDWYCDQMVGNFFELTCPYLYELDTIAHFALIRGVHSHYALAPITETTQVFLEVYSRDSKIFVHPTKVQGRSSPHMYMLHQISGDKAYPISESHTVSEIMRASPRSALGLSQYQLGVWTRTFVQAESILEQERLGRGSMAAVQDTFSRVLRMAISRDERVLKLAEKYLNLADMVAIGKRLLGTGLIGGKSVGVLLARAILMRTEPRWESLLEAHDSYFIPSDVFYTFLVRNKCWGIRKQQIKSEHYLDLHGVQEAQRRVLEGQFPPHMMKRFADMLDYFGQAPIIVRSSSLLEDNFGNSFAGEYESVFCVNQGSPEVRLDAFVAAVKQVYASTMSASALSYRARHNLLDRDEQMGLLVQRVSGDLHGHFYYPHVAGVGFSVNPYVWNEHIDPEAGVLRLVFGLGTRAVDRSDDDYTRLVALNAPERSPETQSDSAARYSQRRVDVLNIETNALETQEFSAVASVAKDVPLSLFSAQDRRQVREARERGLTAKPPPIVRFDRLLSETNFVQDMRDMLRTVADAYEYPVDIEFTANFRPDGTYRINLVQCRPFQVHGAIGLDNAPEQVPPEDLLLQSSGPVIGRSRIDTVDWIVCVSPALYGHLPINTRYSVARLIGQVMRALGDRRTGPIMLLGPGRWGTTTPSLGVPVSFAEINAVSILCEIVAMREDLVPDVSLGTHFFSELVEMDILYLALFPQHEGHVLNLGLLEQYPSLLAEFAPDSQEFADIVQVYDVSKLGANARYRVVADTLRQQAVCYLEKS